jgi:hypothetical protein
MQPRLVLRSVLIVLAVVCSTAVHALSFRAYVSSEGNDANPCTIVAPCRLLPAALNAIVDGGEVWMLDSANYNVGPVDITKSASILAVPGAVGSVVALGGVAININTAGVNVGLRNLVIVPFPGSGGTDGVFVGNAATVTIEDTLIANLAGDGINATGNAPRIRIVNSLIRNNAGYAVRAQNGPTIDVADTKMVGNGGGGVVALGHASSTSVISVSDSLISGSFVGVWVFSDAAGAVTRGSVTRSTIQDTTFALICQTGGTGASAILAVSNNMATNNGYGMYESGTGAVLRSLGNNHVTDNTSADVGTVTPTPPR